MTHEYKIFASKEEALAKVLKNRISRLFGGILWLIGILYLVRWIASENIPYVHLSSLFIISFSVFPVIYMKFRYRRYLYTFLHKDLTTSNLFACGFMMSVCLFTSIVPYIAHITNCGLYFIFSFFIAIIASAIFLWKRAAYLTRLNFIYLYYKVNDKVFFDQQKYITIFTGDAPKAYIAILLKLLIICFALFFINRSFNYLEMELLLGMCPLLMFLLCNIFFIYSIYFFIYVHPSVEKVFNQPILSDQWGFFELDTLLSENTFGKNPIKRAIQYEEVFSK